MTLARQLFLLFILFLSYQVFGQTSGVYRIEGQSSKFGVFSGKGIILEDGTIQRMVRFTSYIHEGNEIEQIWTGSIGPEEINFNVSHSNILTTFEDYSPEKKDFLPFRVQAQVKESFTYVLPTETITEKWTATGEKATELFWKDLRTALPSNGEESFLFRLLRKISKIDKVIENYRNHPEIRAYEHRPEFKSRENYIIKDKTDADFYLKNPHVLRITNKSINPLSLAEATMRRNAYGKTLSEKARFLGEETMTQHFNSEGILENVFYDENGRKVGTEPEYDAALWTAMFGWSEFLRYEVTKDPAALENFRKVLDGMLTLLEITNDPKEFARALKVSPPGEVLREQGWIQGEGKYSHLKWRHNGNNDMLKGLLITFTLAHKVIREDEVELVERIRKNVANLSKLNAVSERDYNLGIAQGLEALWFKDSRKLKDFFENTINFKSTLADINDIGSGFYFGSIADWSGIHLTMVTSMSQFLISGELRKMFTEGNSHKRARKLQEAAEEKLYEMFDIYRPTHRNFLTIMMAAHLPEFQKKNPEVIKEALWALREIPAPRSIGKAEADLSKHPHWSVAGWPAKPWKALSSFRKLREDYDVLNLRQGAYAYPTFEGHAWYSTYVFKDNPFVAKYTSTGREKTYSADYLLFYWLARSGNLITSEE